MPGNAEKFVVADSGIMPSCEPGTSAFGSQFETWVYNQIAALAGFSDNPYDIFQYRSKKSEGQQTRKIDFIVTLGDHHAVGFEVKAGKKVYDKDAEHLKWAQEHANDSNMNFIGVVIYNGTKLYQLCGDEYNIWAVPASYMATS